MRGSDDVGGGADGVLDAGGRVAEAAEGAERGDHRHGEDAGQAEAQPAGGQPLPFAADAALEGVQEVGARLRPLRAKLPLEPVAVLPETLHSTPPTLVISTLCP